MKKLRLKIVVLFFLTCALCFAQTPEKEKKMLDSILNTMNMSADERKFMEQMMEKGMAVEKKRKAKKAADKKKQAAVNKKNAKKAELEFYWRNKIATNIAGKFENWSFGQCDIKVRFSNGHNRPADFLKIGEVSENGQVTIKLPKLDFRKWQTRPITKPSSEGDQMLFNTDHLEFSNENAKYFSTRFGLEIHRGEENLGFLKLGNSVKPVVNLNAPCCFDKAGDGYTAYWVFMSQANSIMGNREFQITGTTDSGKTINDLGKIVHDLNFKAGWNLVLARVEGNIHKPSSGIPDPIFWQNKYYTVSESTPADLKYYFTSQLLAKK